MKKKLKNIISEKSKSKGNWFEKDNHFRYKREVLDILVTKSGDTRTVFRNLGVISKSLSRRPLYLIKYLGIKLHTKHGLYGSANEDLSKVRGYCRGKFGQKQCEKILQEFIDKFVICRSCSNPETYLTIENRGKKKESSSISIRCTACGKSHVIPDQNIPRKMNLTIMKNKPFGKTFLIDPKQTEIPKPIIIKPEEVEEVVWHTDTSLEAVELRRNKFLLKNDSFVGTPVQSRTHRISKNLTWGNSEEKETKKSCFSPNIMKNMTPQKYLISILRRTLEEEKKERKVEVEEVEEEEEEDGEEEILSSINDLKDAHFYFAVKEVKKYFKLNLDDIIRLICESFLIPKINSNVNMEDFIFSHGSFLQHYFISGLPKNMFEVYQSVM